MLALIGPWLARSALMTSPVGGFLVGVWALLKRVPRWAWLALAVVALIFGGYLWAKHAIHQAYADGRKAGYAQAVADINAREAKKVAPLVAAKTAVDARNEITNQNARKTYDAGNAHIDRNVADLLGLYAGPKGQPRSGSKPGVPGVSKPAGAQPALSRADDGLAQAGGEPTITVPARQLISRAAICDRDYTALKAWEDAYTGWRQAYDEWLVKAKKIAPPR
jgi:hypothetical protein